VRVIDIHTHIGNIIYPKGGDLILKMDVPFPKPSLPQRLHEKNLYRSSFLSGLIRKYFINWEINLERRRNAAATLANFIAALNADSTSQASFQPSSMPYHLRHSNHPVSSNSIEIAYCCCLPVAPFVTFDNIYRACGSEPRIIPFTSPDFSLDECEMSERLVADIRAGAAGVKIHPIPQQAEVRQIIKAVEVIAKHSPSLPVLLHAGRAKYYGAKESAREGKDKYLNFASAERIHEIVSAFKNVQFIIGHAGLGEMNAMLKLCGAYRNVYADTSFQPPETITQLIDTLGGDKILFGSDWPYGFRKASIGAAMKACEGDDSLLNAVLYGNAARLLRSHIN
jgi:predicted TIM-barrel fold metal-dependent hydrolase